MSNAQIEQIVIVGGGTAGWMAASALSKFLGTVTKITLIESDAIGTVGVGEATIPQILRLNALLGLDEREVMRATKATFKLGIEFNNWGQIGESYLHTFGDAGLNLGQLHFHHYWLRAQERGLSDSLWDYSLHHRAAYANKFGHVNKVGNTAMTGLAYAYHFDAGLYARLLRDTSEARGVTRIEGKVTNVQRDAETGHIRSVDLESGQNVAGDLFIDCSGFRGLLIGQALGVTYEDWSHWLPCNRAWAVASESTQPLPPYTRATAHEVGWQWRIPLQHRTGNGHVFSADFTSEEAARDTLLDHLDTDAIGEPRLLRFTTGRRETFWAKNCVSLGLASGFLEPLESTSIHLIQSNVSRLLELFPDKSFSPANIAEYNRIVSREYELIRDFLILHYHCTRRDDSEFWNYCRTMDVPDSLTHKMELFREGGRLFRDPEDLFRESSWVQVMLGQGILPDAHHAMADRIDPSELEGFLKNIDVLLERTVSPLKGHAAYLDDYLGTD